MSRFSWLFAASCLWLLPSFGAVAGPTLLYDATTRQVLYTEDADHPWYPASLTKLMTAYVVFEAWKSGTAAPSDKIVISARANSRPKMRLGLGAGKTLSYEEAMSALIMLSANDIAVALAEAVAGSEEAFVERMNATAVRLGMSATRFINPNGLPGEGQHTTARDLARLTDAIMRDFPEHSALFALTTAKVANRALGSHNPAVMRIAGGDGMKTGYTCSAGYNIIASATRDAIRLVAIVLGEESQAKRHFRSEALLEYGFRILEWKAIFPPTTLADLPVTPFDEEKVREDNLAKRYKDCLPPEPELDAEGNPICPAMEVKKVGRAGRAVAVAKVIKGMNGVKRLPEKCIQIALAEARKAPKKAAAAAVPSHRPSIAPKSATANRNQRVQGDGGREYGTALP